MHFFWIWERTGASLKKNGMYVEGGLKKALKNPFLQNLHQDITQCDKDGT